jgi:hypothetical protein
MRFQSSHREDQGLEKRVRLAAASLQVGLQPYSKAAASENSFSC